MKGALLDTSAYVALARNHAGIVESLAETDVLFMSSITLGELGAGFRKGAHFQQNENRLRSFLENEDVRILSIDEETAERYAVIYDFLRRTGAPVAPNDLWIAASAMQHGLHLLTLDGDFKRIPQILIDFF